jgi:hypothetical protein
MSWDNVIQSEGEEWSWIFQVEYCRNQDNYSYMDPKGVDKANTKQNVLFLQEFHPRIKGQNCTVVRTTRPCHNC